MTKISNHFRIYRGLLHIYCKYTALKHYFNIDSNVPSVMTDWNTRCTPSIDISRYGNPTFKILVGYFWRLRFWCIGLAVPAYVPTHDATITSSTTCVVFNSKDIWVVDQVKPKYYVRMFQLVMTVGTVIYCSYNRTTFCLKGINGPGRVYDDNGVSKSPYERADTLPTTFIAPFSQPLLICISPAMWCFVWIAFYRWFACGRIT